MDLAAAVERAGRRPRSAETGIQGLGLLVGLKKWGKGWWGIGNRPNIIRRVYATDPSTHLSHLLSPPECLGGSQLHCSGL